MWFGGSGHSIFILLTSVSLSLSLTASCKSQLSLRSTSDTGHARTLQRPITSGASHKHIHSETKLLIIGRESITSHSFPPVSRTSVSSSRSHSFSPISFLVSVAVCLYFPFLSVSLSFSLLFGFIPPPCLSHFPSLPVCLHFFLSLSLFLPSPSHFPSMSVSLSFTLTIFLSVCLSFSPCLSHSCFPSLFPQSV